MRHTRAVQRDRTKRPPSAPPDEHLVARLTELVHPATLRLVSYYHQLGLRERILTLPVMVAFVLSLIWRQFSGVSELVRLVPLRRSSYTSLSRQRFPCISPFKRFSQSFVEVVDEVEQPLA